MACLPPLDGTAHPFAPAVSGGLEGRQRKHDGQVFGIDLGKNICSLLGLARQILGRRKLQKESASILTGKTLTSAPGSGSCRRTCTSSGGCWPDASSHSKTSSPRWRGTILTCLLVTSPGHRRAERHGPGGCNRSRRDRQSMPRTCRPGSNWCRRERPLAASRGCKRITTPGGEHVCKTPVSEDAGRHGLAGGPD